MPGIYVINIGANTNDSGIARSPIFADASFLFVSFPYKFGETSYADKVRSYVRDGGDGRTHADPDWSQLTYGDCCTNARAVVLKRVERGDILLFWGLLWRNRGASWAEFTGERGWYLFGAIRVEEILREGESVEMLSVAARARALANAHLAGVPTLGKGERVFVGALAFSQLFKHAIPLNVANIDGLLYRTFTDSNGALLSLNGMPAWRSSLRSCRKMWDLEKPPERARAEIVGKAISACNDFDLLTGL